MMQNNIKEDVKSVIYDFLSDNWTEFLDLAITQGMDEDLIHSDYFNNIVTIVLDQPRKDSSTQHDKYYELIGRND